MFKGPFGINKLWATEEVTMPSYFHLLTCFTCIAHWQKICLWALGCKPKPCQSVFTDVAKKLMICQHSSKDKFNWSKLLVSRWEIESYFIWTFICSLCNENFMKWTPATQYSTSMESLNNVKKISLLLSYQKIFLVNNN